MSVQLVIDKKRRGAQITFELLFLSTVRTKEMLRQLLLRIVFLRTRITLEHLPRMCPLMQFINRLILKTFIALRTPHCLLNRV